MTVRATRRALVRVLASCGALAGVATLAPTAGVAQARPVRILVPFAPGGGADLIARLISPHLQQLTGQSFYVENRAGAAGRIGTGVAAKSEPDGHTLLMTTESSIVIAPHIGVAMNYDPLKELAPISLLTRNAVILVVHPSVPAETLKDYMALARAKPGELFYASSGVGGPNHLAGEIFKQMTGLNIVHVPFQGTGAAIPAVISNQVGAMWGFIAGLVPHIRSGSLKALAVGGRGARRPCPTCRRWRKRRARLRGHLVDRAAGARRDAAAADRQALGGDQHRDAGACREGRAAARRSDIITSKPAEFRQIIEHDYAKYGKLADLFRTAK